MTYWHIGAAVLLIALLAIVAVLFIPSFKGARTKVLHWYGVVGIGAVLPIIAEYVSYFQLVDWTQYVPEKYVPWIMLTLGLLTIFLRHRTDTPAKSMTEAVKDTLKDPTKP